MRLILDARTAALGGLIDYAGVFPPASLSVEDAVEDYLRLKASDQQWIVGRFLSRASQLEELAAVASQTFVEGSEPWAVGVIYDRGPGESGVLASSFAREMDPAMKVTGIEAKLTDASPDGVEKLVDAMSVADNEAALFVEVDRAVDFGLQIGAVRDVLVARGRSGGVKLRCGGATPDLFPSVDELTDFIVEATNRQVPFKATAGLHQPVRHFDDNLGVWRHGFVNIVIAGVAAREGADRDTVASIVGEADETAFHMGAATASWRDLHFAGSAVRRSRNIGFTAFGSCDIDEPLDALAAAGMLGDGT